MPIIREVKINEKQNSDKKGLAAEMRAIKTNGYMAARKIDSLEKVVGIFHKQINTNDHDINELAERVLEDREKIKGSFRLMAVAIILLAAALIAHILLEIFAK